MPVDTTTATTFGFEAEAVSVPAITGELNLDSSESQSGRGNAPEKGAGLCTHWKKVPFFNLIGFLFLSAKPHGYKEISSILVNIGLISALLFTIVGAIPLSITAEEVYANDNYHGPVIPGITELELNAIVQRAITEPGSVEIGRAGCIRHGNFLMEPYSFEMWHNYITSVHLLGITLVLSVFMNLSLVALHGDKKEDFDGPFAPILRRWWDYTKYAIGLVVIILLISIVLAFRTLHYVAHMKGPIYLHEMLCKEAGWVYARTDEETGAKLYVNGTFIEGPGRLERMSARNKYLDHTGYNMLWQLYIMIPIIVLVLIPTGYANYVADVVVQMQKRND